MGAKGKKNVQVYDITEEEIREGGWRDLDTEELYLRLNCLLWLLFPQAHEWESESLATLRRMRDVLCDLIMERAFNA